MRRIQLHPNSRCRGFTMVELVVSLVIATIVAGFVAMMITTPVDAYFAQSRRAELSDAAETAMRFIAADVRRALPDSLRQGVVAVNGRWALEMIEVSAVAGYRQWTTGDSLDINTTPDSSFDVAGVQFFPGRPVNRLVVAPGARTPPAFDPYLNGAVITPAVGANINYSIPNQNFSIGPPHSFPRASVNQRVYGVVGTTRLEWDPAAGVLLRYVGLPIVPTMDPVAGGTIIARDVSACAFRVLNSSTSEHGGIAIVQITVSRVADGNTENLRVVRQLRVENLP